MARLNESHNTKSTNGLGEKEKLAYETVKRRFLRQNQEIARSNSTQAVRIRTLEVELAKMWTENISLREQIIQLQTELERRDNSRQIFENVEATRQKLQSKVVEMNQLLSELGIDMLSKRPQDPVESKSSLYYESRLCDHQNIPASECIMSPIIEDVISRRSSLIDNERRRSSFSFLETDLPPPEPEPYVSEEEAETGQEDGEDKEGEQEYEVDEDEEQEEDAEGEESGGSSPSPLKNVSQTRRWKRRDSYLLQAGEPVPEPIKTATPKKTPKWPLLEVSTSSSDLDSRLSKLSMRSTDVERRQVETERRRSSFGSDQTTKEEYHIMTQKQPPIAAKFDLDKLEPSKNETLASEPVRKALGPKSANSDPKISPFKLAAARCEQNSIERPEKPSKNSPLPTEKFSSLRVKDTPPPDSDPSSTTTGRIARRARQAVSYAEPSLRVKMRREDTGPDGAVKKDGKVRRSASLSSTASRKRRMLEFENENTNDAIKKEEDEEIPLWLNLPKLKPTERGSHVQGRIFIDNPRNTSAGVDDPITPKKPATVVRKRKSSSHVENQHDREHTSFFPSLSGIDDRKERPAFKETQVRRSTLSNSFKV